MAALTSGAQAPFPPGDYPLVIVGSGPGGIQLSYDLTQLGVEHAFLSRDPAPGGMFRRFPIFERLNTCTRRHAVCGRNCSEYYRFDWNSMVAQKPAHRALVAEFMESAAYFPTRAEMEAALVAFTERAGVTVRYGCEWRSTRRDDEGRFVLETTDGEYISPVVVFAVGMAEPWRPSVPGIEHVPHYVDIVERPLDSWEGRSVFVIGKRNSGFEVADALLPWARQVILGSPHPARPSILTGFPTPPRARYLEPLEDHLFAGGTVVLDITLDRIERTAEGFRVFAQGTTRPGEIVVETEEAIACTGFGTPMRDLPELGVETFYRDRLPAQTAYWESTSVPGIFFAGAPTQGQAGMRKYGWPSRSASVGGFRFNAKVQASYIARTHFGIERTPVLVSPDDVVSLLLHEATEEPGIWSQQSNLARVLAYDPSVGIRDEGLLPLAPFVDATGEDAVAITVETDTEENVQPAVYVRHGGRVSEHVFWPNAMNDFTGQEYCDRLSELLLSLGRQ